MVCKLILIILSLLILPLPRHGYGLEPPRYSTDIQWEKNRIVINVSFPISPEETGVFKTRTIAEEELRRQFPYILREALSTVQIDSLHTFEEYLKEDPTLMEALFSIARMSGKTPPLLSKEMDYLSVTYSIPIFPVLGEPFILHEHPISLPIFLKWKATTDFTGIIIYMKGEYPVHGEKDVMSLEPSLFPRIFDQYMNPILTKNMMEPRFLKQWGVVQYTSEFDETPYRNRIGDKPLRIIGKGLFGKANTDILISQDAAEMLLANDNNRTLLKEGRIVVIWDGAIEVSPSESSDKP